MSNNQSIQKIFNEYQIQLSIILDSINSQIQKQDSINIYESNFNIEYLRKNKLLIGNLTIQEMIDFINSLIANRNIIIEKNNENLKLIIISIFPIYPNV